MPSPGASAALRGRKDYFPGASFGADFTRGRYKLGKRQARNPASLPGWTFTRASTGYAETAAGALVAFASGAPRITDKGLLVEEARTNLVTYSQDFDNASWTKVAGGTGLTPVVTANDALAPDGTLTADKIVLSLAGGTASGDQSLLAHSSFATSAASTYQGTVYVKGVAGEKICLRHVAAAGYAIHTFTGGWDRIARSEVAGGASSSFDFGLRGNIGGTSNAVTFWAWGADCQLGSFPTSYIPTTTASATRAADVATITGLSIPSPLSIYGEWTKTAESVISTSPRVASLFDGSSIEQGIYHRNSTNAVRAIVTTTVDSTLGTGSLNSTMKGAARFATNDVTGSLNGAAVVSDTSATVSTGATLTIGTYDGHTICAYIRRVVIYPYAMTNAQLQAAST